MKKNLSSSKMLTLTSQEVHQNTIKSRKWNTCKREKLQACIYRDTSSRLEKKQSTLIGYQNSEEMILHFFCFAKVNYYYFLLNDILHLKLKSDVKLLTSVPKTLRPKICKHLLFFGR